MDGVTVTVKVPEGALPVDAELKATMIDQSSEEYAKAEQALSEQEETYDGMVALDIRFEVGDQEVEPLKEVEVSIDAQALLPEDADPETVAVQHLKEDETGAVVAVETVADATEETGDVTVEATQTEEPAMDMASTFAVDGFSTFTITWGYYFKVTVHYVDEEGKEIEGMRDESDSIQKDESKNFGDYANDIKGYTFIEARYANANGKVVTRVEATEETQWYPLVGDVTTRILTFYNEEKKSKRSRILLGTKLSLTCTWFMRSRGAVAVVPLIRERRLV